MGLITSLIDPDSSSNGGGGGLIGAIKRRSSGNSNTASTSTSADPDNYKRGGLVKKTGMAKVHKGEKVLTKKQTKRYRTKGSGR